MSDPATLKRLHNYESYTSIDTSVLMDVLFVLLDKLRRMKASSTCPLNSRLLIESLITKTKTNIAAFPQKSTEVGQKRLINEVLQCVSLENIPHCENCFQVITETTVGSTMVCVACKSVRYCSHACKLEARDTHSEQICHRLAKVRDHINSPEEIDRLFVEQDQAKAALRRREMDDRIHALETRHIQLRTDLERMAQGPPAMDDGLGVDPVGQRVISPDPMGRDLPADPLERAEEVEDAMAKLEEKRQALGSSWGVRGVKGSTGSGGGGQMRDPFETMGLMKVLDTAAIEGRQLREKLREAEEEVVRERNARLKMREAHMMEVSELKTKLALGEYATADKGCQTNDGDVEGEEGVEDGSSADGVGVGDDDVPVPPVDPVPDPIQATSRPSRTSHAQHRGPCLQRPGGRPPEATRDDSIPVNRGQKQGRDALHGHQGAAGQERRASPNHNGPASGLRRR